MATYAFTGFSYTQTDTLGVLESSVTSGKLEVVTEHSSPTISYSVLDTTETVLQVEVPELGNIYDISVDGISVDYRLSTLTQPVALLTTIEWGANNSSTFLTLGTNYTDGDTEYSVATFVLILGDPIPDFADTTALETWFAAITGNTADMPEGFDPDTPFALNYVGGSKSEADDFSGSDGSDTVSLGAGVDRFDGLGGNDTINGGAGVDFLDGGDGNDNIQGGDDRDILNGNAGNDTVNGNAGNDSILGGSGNDNLSGGDGNDKLKGGAGQDTLRGGDGADKLYGGNQPDTLFGDAGNDLVDGQNHDDVISGGDGNDRLKGRQGDDTLRGDDGDDTLYGGRNQDVLIGGTGDDMLHGGNHADEFVFYADLDEGADVILDFELGLDQVLIAETGSYTVTDTGTDTTITFAIGGTVTIENLTGWGTEDAFITNVLS